MTIEPSPDEFLQRLKQVHRPMSSVQWRYRYGWLPSEMRYRIITKTLLEIPLGLDKRFDWVEAAKIRMSDVPF